MIRTLKVIFCDEEHGTGDVTFPDLRALTPAGYVSQSGEEKGPTAAELRKKAKAVGWGRINGGDFCPGCMESL